MNITNLSASVVVAVMCSLLALPVLAKDDRPISVASEIGFEDPSGCLRNLMKGYPDFQICGVRGQSLKCAMDGKSPSKCDAELAFFVDTGNPTPSLFRGRSCYPIVLTEDVYAAKQLHMRIEAIGKLCFTPSGNFIEATSTCVAPDASTVMPQRVGDFRGTMLLDEGNSDGKPVILRGIHNETAVPISSVTR